MSNIVTNHTVSGESWILVPSVTPSDAKTSTESTLDTTVEVKTFSSSPVTLSPNLTIEVTSSEETVSTEKLGDTTLEPTSGEEIDDSTEYGTSSEYPESGEEDETTTETAETEPININLTSSTIAQWGNETSQLLMTLICVSCS